MENKFRNIVYAKLNIDFDRELFIEEYDKFILPDGMWISNKNPTNSAELNDIWGMVPSELYCTTDYFEQDGDYTTSRTVRGERRMWIMKQLMSMRTEGITDPYMLKMAPLGGPGLRNVTLSTDYKFFVKPEFENLEIVKWIQNLPIEEIHSLHCVSLAPGCFATIHRDQKSMYDGDSSAGMSKVFNSGFVTLSLNISSGGSPLWYALDGKDITKPYKVDDPVFITNDYFSHGVGVCTERRRQIRITAIPKPELYDLIDQSTLHEIPLDYQYDPIIPIHILGK